MEHESDVVIVIGALATVTKGSIKGLEDLKRRGPMETIKMTVLLSARILRRMLQT